MIISMVFSRELNVEFVSENTWLMGVPIAGGESFDNSTMYGLGLYGTSSISPFDAVDVDIHFLQTQIVHQLHMYFLHLV